MGICIPYNFPFPYSFGSRVTTICLPLPCAHPVSPKGSVTCPFRYSVRSIHYCRLSLNSCHNTVRLLFRCSHRSCRLGCGIFSDLQPDFAANNSLTIHPVHATNAQQVPNSIGREQLHNMAPLTTRKAFIW